MLENGNPGGIWAVPQDLLTFAHSSSPPSWNPYLLPSGYFKNAKCSEKASSSDWVPRLTCGVQFNKAVLCMLYPKSKGQGVWWP